MPLRVYFNRSADAPFVWSVDRGTSDTEVVVSEVFIGPACVVRARYNGERANENTPVAWMEVEDGVVSYVDGPAGSRKALITPLAKDSGNGAD